MKELGSSEGNILENEELLNSLENTKQKSQKIVESLEESKKLQISLESEREVYRPLATTGTTIYLLLKDLRVLNHMYSFSLQEFSKIFTQNLQRGAGLLDSSTEELLTSLKQSLFKSVFTRLGFGLFKKDKLAFGLHLVKEIKSAASLQEFTFLIGSSPPSGKTAPSRSRAGPQMIASNFSASILFNLVKW